MMNPSQLAVTTKCYCDFPLERALAGIASCEITGVELCASVGWYGLSFPISPRPGPRLAVTPSPLSACRVTATVASKSTYRKAKSPPIRQPVI